jgi:hypothetical protein
MNIAKVALSAAVFAATCCPFLSAQDKKTAIPTKESCLAFVQEFYGWYVPKARDINVHSLDLALKERRSAFNPRLIKGVEAVEADATRNQEAGLDFDWILNSQDPGDPGEPGYLARNSKLNGNVCHVEVSRQRPDGKGERIVPELNFEHGRWLFVNFHYPDSPYPQSENLMSMIKAYLNSVSESSKKAH